jgi:hypothetical protein
LGLALLALVPLPGVAAAQPHNGTAATATGTVTVDGATVVVSADGQGPVAAGAGVQSDVQALQTTADSTPGLSKAQKAAIHGRIAHAQHDARALTTAALPSGAQAGSFAVTASASADGTAISVDPTAHRCRLQQATRQVDITTLEVDGVAC